MNDNGCNELGCFPFVETVFCLFIKLCHLKCRPVIPFCFLQTNWEQVNLYSPRGGSHYLSSLHLQTNKIELTLFINILILGVKKTILNIPKSCQCLPQPLLFSWPGLLRSVSLLSVAGLWGRLYPETGSLLLITSIIITSHSPPHHHCPSPTYKVLFIYGSIFFRLQSWERKVFENN